MRITIIGSGYVGLVAGTCFADSGQHVTCVDVDASKINLLNRGLVPIYEPGLEEMIHRNVAAGRLFFSTDLRTAVAASQVVFIAVGTPESETGEADLAHVLTAAKQIGESIKQYTVVVDKSTVPVTTSEKVAAVMAQVTTVEFDVVSNPEFLKEGSALEDFLRPERVVIGTTSLRARKIMGDLYAPFSSAKNPIFYMDARSAELTKYACNAMLATRISFMNDIGNLCEAAGADVEAVRRGMGSDSRIGAPFLSAGVGYGGSCFPKDVKALVATARSLGLEFELLRAVERTNERQKRVLLKKAMKHFGSLSGLKVAVWGLAFKPETDDMREAPSVELIEGLLGKGARVVCYDPVATPVAARRFGQRVHFASTQYEALEGADALFVVTEWNELRDANFVRVKELMAKAVLFDGRNMFDPASVEALGFTYYGIGRGARGPKVAMTQPNGRARRNTLMGTKAA